MGHTLTKTSLEVETAYYRGTNGLSENNRRLGFQSAFLDRATGTVYLSRFADGRLAPFHLLDGLPPELVLARDEQEHVTQAKASLESGFARDGQNSSGDARVRVADLVAAMRCSTRPPSASLAGAAVGFWSLSGFPIPQNLRHSRSP